MTTQDIAIIIVMGLIGYWGVGALIDHFKSDKASPLASESQIGPLLSKQSKHWAEILEISPDSSQEAITLARTNLLSRYSAENINDLGSEFRNLAHDRIIEIEQAYKDASHIKPISTRYSMPKK